jgi:hypothetical protein
VMIVLLLQEENVLIVAVLTIAKNKVWHIGLYLIGVIGFLLTSPEKFDMLST